MQHIPFAPWMRGNRALDLVRNADGPKESAAPLTYYSAVLRAHDLLADVSTLADYIAALGGSLELLAVFPEGTVRIDQFGNSGDG